MNKEFQEEIDKYITVADSSTLLTIIDRTSRKLLKLSTNLTSLLNIPFFLSECGTLARISHSVAIFKVSINLGRFKSQSKSYDHHAIKLEISSHSTEKISGNIWKVNKNTSKEIKDYLENMLS